MRKRFMGKPYIIGWNPHNTNAALLEQLSKIAKATKVADKKTGIDWDKGKPVKRSANRFRKAVGALEKKKK